MMYSNHMQIPCADIFDKLSILELKRRRLPDDKLLMKQYEAYRDEKNRLMNNLNFDDRNLATQYYNELSKLNTSIWDIENEIREGGEKHIPLEEIGRRALKVRNYNGMRTIIKNKLSTLFNQELYKEVKIDHVSKTCLKNH